MAYELAKFSVPRVSASFSGGREPPSFLAKKNARALITAAANKKRAAAEVRGGRWSSPDQSCFPYL